MIDLMQLLAFCDGTEASALVALDWLQEHDATTADLLVAFRGDPPDYLLPTLAQEEGLHGILWRWLERTEPEAREPVHPGSGWAALIPRWEAVQLCAVRMPIVDVSLERGTSHPIISRARRDRKRVVLSLFPDVIHERRFTLELRSRHMVAGLEADARLREGGWRVDAGVSCEVAENDRTATWTHTLAAPDWIEPEPLTSLSLDEQRRIVEQEEADFDRRIRRARSITLPPLPGIQSPIE